MSMGDFLWPPPLPYRFKIINPFSFQSEEILFTDEHFGRLMFRYNFLKWRFSPWAIETPLFIRQFCFVDRKKQANIDTQQP